MAQFSKTAAPIWERDSSRLSWLPFRCILVVAAFAFLGSSARAATIWWDGTGATWSNLSSWGDAVSSTTDPASVPGAADIASFSISTVITAQTVNLGTSNQSALGLVFLGTNASTTLLQAGGTTRSLTLADSGITVDSGAGPVTIGSTTAGQNVTVLLGADQTWTNNSAAGALTIVNDVAPGTAVARTLTLAGTSTASNTVSGIIADNGAGAMGLIKSGVGTWVLSGANTYTGTTTLSDGVLRLQSPNALPGGIGSAGGSSNLNINGGVVGLGNGDFTRGLGIGATQVQFTGSGGFAAYTANRSVNLGGSATPATVTWNFGGFVPGGSALILGAADSDKTVTFENPINFNGDFRTVQVNNGSAAVDATLSGVLSSGGLTKTGAGTLSLTAENIYSGPTTVGGGVLRLDSANALPGGIGIAGGTSNLTINSGVVGLGYGDFSRWLGTNPTQVQFLGSGGFAAYTADRNVNLGDSVTPSTVYWGFDGFVPNGSALILGAGDADKTLTFQNPINFLGGFRTVQVDDGLAAVDATLSGGLSSGGLTKTGAGTLSLSGQNTHTGPTTISAGTLQLDRSTPDNSAIPTDGILGTVGDIVISGGTLQIVQSEQIGDTGSITLSSGAFNFGSATGKTENIGTFTNNGGAFTTGANTLIGTGSTMTWAGGTNTISSGGTVKDKHWVITGGTNTVNGGGTLEVQTGGGTSGLFFGGTSSPTVTLDSSAGTAGRMMLKQDVTVDGTLTSGTARILSGGSLINPGFIDMDGGTRTWSVGNGSAAVDLLVSASIQNGALTKTGAGTMKLAGANTYTGATLINGGTLEVGEGSALANTNITVNSGGSLLLSGAINSNRIGNSAAITLNGGTIIMGGSGSLDEQVGTLSLSASSVIDFGTFVGGNILRFADSTGATWGAFTLSIWNWTEGADHLYFGSVLGAGLPLGGLSMIRFYYDSGTTPADGALVEFGPDDGEVAPLPEPSAVLIGLSLLSLAGYRERRWLFRCREARREKTA